MTMNDDHVDWYRVWWDETTSVGWTVWSPGLYCRLPEAQAVLASIAALHRGTIPMLVDIREAGPIDRPARELFSRAGGPCSSVALLAGSAVTRMAANIFLGFNRPAIPTKMFTSEAEAVDWLRTQP